MFLAHYVWSRFIANAKQNIKENSNKKAAAATKCLFLLW
jgi:hypothetical protein